MVPVGTDLVRVQVVGGTAIKLGQACDGGDRGFLGLGSKPLQFHVSNHFGTSWGHGGAPLYARGIRVETPPAGASTEPHTRQKVRTTKHKQCSGKRMANSGLRGERGTMQKGKRQGKTAAQRLSATYNCTATRRLSPSYGVYYGSWQPLSLITALSCLTLAKTA